jgi:hypothetical protein
MIASLAAEKAFTVDVVFLRTSHFTMIRSLQWRTNKCGDNDLPCIQGVLLVAVKHGTSFGDGVSILRGECTHSTEVEAISTRHCSVRWWF